MENKNEFHKPQGWDGRDVLLWSQVMNLHVYITANDIPLVRRDDVIELLRQNAQYRYEIESPEGLRARLSKLEKEMKRFDDLRKRVEELEG